MSADADDQASVRIEKEKKFVSQIPNEMKDTSIVALLQRYLHRNTCDP